MDAVTDFVFAAELACIVVATIWVVARGWFRPPEKPVHIPRDEEAAKLRKELDCVLSELERKLDHGPRRHRNTTG